MMPAQSGEVQLGFTADGRRWLSGLMRCGSVWACPMCAPVIRERRAAQLDVLYSTLLALGYRLFLVTATVQHHEGHTLGQLLGDGRKRTGLLGAWRCAFSGRAMSSSGYAGQVKAVDLTVGDHGWHPHIHAVVAFGPETTEADAQSWLTARRTRYVQRLGVTGLAAAEDRRGWDVRPIETNDDLASYMAKVEGGWGAGLEQARGDLKAGRRGGRTIWQVLQSAVEGDWDDAVLWAEHERATKGRRLIVAGRSLIEAAKAVDSNPLLDELEEDERDLAEPTPDDVLAYVETWTASQWARLYLQGRAAEVERAAFERGVRLGFIERPPPDS